MLKNGGLTEIRARHSFWRLVRVWMQWVWGKELDGDSGTVKIIVNRLRRRLARAAAAPVYIFTEPSVGYRMSKGEDTDAGAYGHAGPRTSRRICRSGLLVALTHCLRIDRRAGRGRTA